MSSYTLNFAAVWQHIGDLGTGLLVTLYLTGISVTIGLVGGFLVALMMRSSWKSVSWLAVGFVEIFRCTPSLIQLIWIIYCVPIFLGIYVDPMKMAILALSLNNAAYNAEAYRAAIQSIPKAHIETSIALGLSPLERTIYVVLPQALLFAVPVLLTNAVGLLQETSLVAIVAIGDLMYKGKMLATEIFRPIEILTVVAVIYLMVAIPVSQIVSLIDQRLRSYR